MLAVNSGFGRRTTRVTGLGSTSTIPTSFYNSNIYALRPRLLLKNHNKQKILGNLSQYTDATISSRMKRLKTKKPNGAQKMDLSRKKSVEYTEMAYREAVSKLKYLLAESYTPRTLPGKSHGIRSIYRTSNSRINESGEDTDDHSIISDSSRTKDIVRNTRTFASSYLPTSKTIYPSKAYSSLALSAADLQSVPPELTSFIERQEEYIEQLEKESQYCREELTNLLRKVREVVAENEALHSKNKTGFLKSTLEEHSTLNEENHECSEQNGPQPEAFETRKHRLLEGPIIVFESRISELEAQLTQAKLELRKAQEENELNLQRLSENSSSSMGLATKDQLEHAVRAKCETELKLEELQKALSNARDRESDALQKAKRAVDAAQQMEFEKTQCEAEVKRLKDELDRQHDRLREATQEANRRLAEERQHAERRYSQQVDQLSADVASHWDAANKSQLESEKQRRELMELRRELSQKQTFTDNLKKELQNKISNLQSEVNQALSEKDAAEQEVLSTKLAAERNERQARQEQSRLQTEINSYKQRLERADADLVHCRRENLRLSEQIASLEKEISMIKTIHSDEPHTPSATKSESGKELASMIMDMETKHEGITERDVPTVGKTASTSNKKRTVTVDLKVKVIPKKKEEIANLQSNIEYLTNKIESSIQTTKGAAPCENNIEDDNNKKTSMEFETVDEKHNISTKNDENLDNENGEEVFSVIEENTKPETLHDNLTNDGLVTTDYAPQDNTKEPVQYEEESEVRGNGEERAPINEGSISYSAQQEYNQPEQFNPVEYSNEECVNYDSTEPGRDLQYSAQETEQDTLDPVNSTSEIAH